MDGVKRWMVGALIVGWLAVVAFLVRPPALTGDEAYYAQVPVEMRQRGDWLVPYFNGEPRYKKPPLMYWLVASAQAVFGENEQASRLPSLVAAFLTAALLWWFGRKMEEPMTGALAASVFLLNPMTFVLANWGAPEATLCLFVTASTLFGLMGLCTASPFLRFSVSHASPAPRPASFAPSLWFALSGATAGLGVLTKGAPGIALPFLALAPFVVKAGWQERDLSKLLRFVGAAAVLWCGTTLLVAAPWFLAVGWREGEAFWQVFFFREHLQRVASPMEGHRGPVWFYLLVLWLAFFPWSSLLPHAVVAAFGTQDAGRRTNGEPTRTSVDTAVAWWGLSVVGLFSLVATKLPHYIFPAFPAFAWLVAKQWQRSLPTRAMWLAVGLAVTALLLVTFGAVLLPRAYVDFLAKFGFSADNDLLLLRVSLVALLCGWAVATVTAVRAFSRFPQSPIPSPLTGAAALTLGVGVAAFLLLHASGAREAVEMWRQFPQVATFGSDTEWAVFYAKRPVPFLRGDSERVATFLRANKRAAVLLRVDFVLRLPPEKVTVHRFGVWCVAHATEQE